MAATRRLAAIVFTDIAGYTTLAQSDEAGALRLLQEQDKLIRPLLEAHRGRRVKSIGDGLLIEFHNALDAIECAVDLQRQIHERNPRDGERPLRVRVGIHLGDVQRRGTDILGDAVNIASRVEPLADPGGYASRPRFTTKSTIRSPTSWRALARKTSREFWSRLKSTESFFHGLAVSNHRELFAFPVSPSFPLPISARIPRISTSRMASRRN